MDHQESTTAKETLASKKSFESFAARYNRHIKHIHADNGIYAKSSFVNSMNSNNQSYTFCGVGAHWQNGSVESYIGHLTAKARSMLLHAMHKWPNVVTSEFWPFAFKQAAKLHNLTPTKGSNQSPYQIFTNEDSNLTPTDFRTLF